MHSSDRTTVKGCNNNTAWVYVLTHGKIAVFIKIIAFMNGDDIQYNDRDDPPSPFGCVVVKLDF